MVPSPGFQSRFFVLANENRTQDAGHALLRQGRNPKVRKNSGVIFSTDMLIDRGYLVDKYATGEGRYKLTLSDDDRDALQRLCDHAVDPN